MIETDPRSSARPAEGIRIAAGIGAWKKTDVTLVLRGPVAGYSLQEYADELVDEDNFTRYLPFVVEAPRPIYLEDSFTDAGCAGRFAVEVRNHFRREDSRADPQPRLPDPFMSEASPRRILHLVVEGFPPERREELAASGDGSGKITEIFQLTEASVSRSAGEDLCGGYYRGVGEDLAFNLRLVILSFRDRRALNPRIQLLRVSALLLILHVVAAFGADKKIEPAEFDRLVQIYGAEGLPLPPKEAPLIRFKVGTTGMGISKRIFMPWGFC